MTSSAFRVAICGGGIGGLSLALVLHKFASKNVQIDIYEAKDKFAEIGAGIGVWRRPYYIFQTLGLDKALDELAVPQPSGADLPSYTFRRSDVPEGGRDFCTFEAPYGWITVHRADMLKLLTDSLPAVIGTHLSKRLVGYNDEGPRETTLSFSDGTTAKVDVLIGADGLKSATREIMYRNLADIAKVHDEPEARRLQKYINPTWSGSYAYRALIDAEKLLKVAPDYSVNPAQVMNFGKHKHLLTYPVSKGRYINFVSSVTHVGKDGAEPEGPLMVDVPIDELKREHDGWEMRVQQLISCIEKCSRWSICQNRDIPYFVAGNVALMGDAAHAMTPNLGAGAGQALEDAYILGRLLADDLVNAENTHVALRIYETVRKPFATKVADLSRTCGNAYHFDYIPDSLRESGSEVTSPEGLKVLSDFIRDIWKINWENLPEDQWIEAKTLLKERIEIRLSI